MAATSLPTGGPFPLDCRNGASSVFGPTDGQQNNLSDGYYLITLIGKVEYWEPSFRLRHFTGTDRYHQHSVDPCTTRRYLAII